MASGDSHVALRTPLAGFLSWVLPGLGHIYLGYCRRGLILLAVITATFWGGVAIGGVRSTVDPKERKLWFSAQLCTGSHALAAYALHQRVITGDVSPGSYLSSEVGVHYAGVAGLLNILVILDAVSRADLRSKRGTGVLSAPQGGGG